MRKGIGRFLAAVLGLTLASAAGCGGEGQMEKGSENSSLSYFDGDVDEPSVTEEYACEEEYGELAAFLAEYYEVPKEYRAETRYYYNYFDLNNDGVKEIFAVVIGEYTEQEGGDPALLLAEEKDGGFTVLKALDGIRTPVLICDQTTDGWHDFIYKVYGFGTETGYRVCRYRADSGYHIEEDELLDERPRVSGTQILSNNLIDDMDRGRYLTLSP